MARRSTLQPRIAAWAAHHPASTLALLSVAVGVAAAYGALGFLWLLYNTQWLFFGDGTDRLVSGIAALPWWQILFAPAVGGLMVGVFLRLVMPGGRPMGVADVIESTAPHGRFSFTRGILGAIASAVSLGVGASVGREGPVIHLGANIGGALGQRLGLARPAMVMLGGAGVAAAISASFNAPIAAAIFALEVVVGHYRLHALLAAGFGAATGAVITRIHFGDAPLFTLPVHHLGSYLELGAFLLLGVLAALVAMLFMAVVVGASDAARSLKLPQWLKPCLAGLAVGGIALYFPHVLGVGYEATELALQGRLALWMLAALVLAKILATAISLGLGFSGGVFSPSLVTGAMLGGAFGMALALMWPGATSSPSIYVMAGMGAVAASVLGAPISTLIIVLEFTQNHALAMPIMLTILVSVAISRQFVGKSLFAWQLRRRGVAAGRLPHEAALAAIPLAPMVERSFAFVGVRAGVEEIYAKLRDSADGAAFVVAPLSGGGFTPVGLIAWADMPAARDEDNGNVADDRRRRAEDLMRPFESVLHRDGTLADAVRALSGEPNSIFAVVESAARPRLIGILRAADIVRAAQAAMAASAVPPPDSPPGPRK
ncbi:MAG: chloride channel protein [Alphaproteobacteria bacterium]